MKIDQPSDDIYRSILEEVLNEIKPREEDYAKLREAFEIARSIVDDCLRDLGKRFEITLQGSFAKDTFLRSDADIDIFLLFDPSQADASWFENVLVPRLDKCFRSRGFETILEYATHPYLTVLVNGIEVNIVPAFRVDDPRNLVSAVDRTPFHTEYVVKKLSHEQRDEVRLLKKFLKANGIYGAEVGVQGFSGYLVELLIAAYGSFLNVLRASLRWRAYETCIDIEGYYRGEEECLKSFPKSVLVVVDPVDPKRNAAAAVSLKSFATFKTLSALFLRCPSRKFFEVNSYVPSFEELERIENLRREELDVATLFIVFEIAKKVPDVVWGQLRKLERIVVKKLPEFGYHATYVDSWVSKNLDLAVMIVEIAGYRAKHYLHQGPPAYDPQNAVRFVEKNLGSVVGPWIWIDGKLYTYRAKKPVEEAMEKIVKSLNLSSLNLRRVSMSIERIEYEDYRRWLYEALTRSRLRELLSSCIEHQR